MELYTIFENLISSVINNKNIYLKFYTLNIIEII